MQKFFQSGGAFMAVALICMAVGLISRHGAVFVSLGAFWLIMAIVVRSKNAKKSPPQ